MTYYWYRIPALAGFGVFPGDVMLVDLSGVLPPWFVPCSRLLTVALFAWWLFRDAAPGRSWLLRPPIAAMPPRPALVSLPMVSEHAR